MPTQSGKPGFSDRLLGTAVVDPITSREISLDRGTELDGVDLLLKGLLARAAADAVSTS